MKQLADDVFLLDSFPPDPAPNRESMRRLAALDPALVCFGHGLPLRDPARPRTFVRSLPHA
jgi:hydroxyacylglutathione hydrolase